MGEVVTELAGKIVESPLVVAEPVYREVLFLESVEGLRVELILKQCEVDDIRSVVCSCVEQSSLEFIGALQIGAVIKQSAGGEHALE